MCLSHSPVNRTLTIAAAGRARAPGPHTIGMASEVQGRFVLRFALYRHRG